MEEVFGRVLPNYTALANLIFSESGPILGELIASPNIVPSHFAKFADAVFLALRNDGIEGILLSL
jgi:hypothetical protein